MLLPKHHGSCASSVARGEAMRETEFSKRYYLDESDPDIVILRREDGTFVAAFSGWGATKEGITEAAREDHETLIRRPA